VAINPRRGGVATRQTLGLTATVTNDVGAAGVTWTVTGGTLTGQTPTTAVFSSTASGSFIITATSNVDGTKSASTTIGVTDLGGVLTYHNNPSRDGANTHEFALTPSNVTTATFGKLFSCPVDGEVYAQPLWVPNVAISGGTHNMIFVATENDSVYAVRCRCRDPAGSTGRRVSWARELRRCHKRHGEAFDINKKIGITGTPVIDMSSMTIYVVAKNEGRHGELVTSACTLSA